MRERIQGIWSGAQEKLKDFYQDEREEYLIGAPVEHQKQTASL